MGQYEQESTRVMGAGGVAPIDRTMVAPPPGGAAATQMGAMVECPVCHASSPGLETFCVECGFVLASAPGVQAAAPDADSGVEGFALVESSSGRRFSLTPGVNTVGRENCDVLLMDGTVSRRHANVTVKDGTVTVTDLGSTNGTQVNGSALSANQETPLGSGGSVRFGNATFTLEAPGAPAEATIVSAAPPEATMALPAEGEALEAADQTLGDEPVAEEAVPDSSDSVDAATVPAPADAAAAAPVQAVLKPSTPDLPTIEVREGTTSIGRRAGNDVVIVGDPYVSGQHAEVTCDNSGCYVVDVGSTNGTVVNGTRLTAGDKQLLLDGDEVTIGQGAYVFQTVAVDIVLPPDEEKTGEPNHQPGGDAE